MTVKYKDIEFTIKDVNTAKFRRDQYFLLSDLYDSVNKYGGDSLKGYYDFFLPEKDGEVVPRFKDVCEAFLETTEGIDFDDMGQENTDALVKLGIGIVSFFLSKTGT